MLISPWLGDSLYPNAYKCMPVSARVTAASGPDQPYEIFRSSSSCKKFPSPTNGFLYCRADYCIIRCKDGFQFDSEPANGYLCHPTGVWTAVPPEESVPWPNCTLKGTAD
ncbi:unnamed protein product [Caretta caretta]